MRPTRLPQAARPLRSRASSTTPAASASSPTSRASARTTSSRRAWRSSQNLTHRGACGCDPLTGDGAGILMQIPRRVPRARSASRSASRCPRRASTASAWSSCRATSTSATTASASSRRSIREEGQKLLGWRACRSTTTHVRRRWRARVMPEIRQIFIGARHATTPTRRRSSASSTSSASASSALVRESGLRDSERFYVPSLSSRTIVYKGLLLPEQIPAFYHDLADPRLRERAGARAPALQHQHVPVLGPRPSRTASSPTTARSTRCAATSTGCTRARAMFASPLFGDDIEKLLPIIDAERQRLGDVRQRARAAACTPAARCRTRS